MSIAALGRLRAIGFLDKEDRAVDLSRFDPAAIKEKLDYYRMDSLQGGRDGFTTPAETKGGLAALVSSVSARNCVSQLVPYGLIYNRLYVNDPLLDLIADPEHSSEAYNTYLGVEAGRGPELAIVSNRVRYFELLAPVIRSGLLTVLPLKEDRARRDGIPVYFSEDWFRSSVPRQIHDFVHESAVINEMTPGPGGRGLRVLDHAPTGPTRAISVSFANDFSAADCPFYLLFEQEVLERIDDTHFRFAHRLPWDKPPSQDLFKVWVYQSINRTIINRIRAIEHEVGIASQLGASYLTESQFEAELCGKTFSSDRRGSVNAVNFLVANAPSLNVSDPSILIRLRSDHPELFERWQQALLSVANELSGTDVDFEERARQLLERDVRPQLDDLNRALARLQGEAGGACLTTIGTIALALYGNAALPLVAVLGLGALLVAGRVLPSVSDYLSRRESPAFIWSRILK